MLFRSDPTKTDFNKNLKVCRHATMGRTEQKPCLHNADVAPVALISLENVGHEGTPLAGEIVCSYDACGRAAVKRGWCETHYKAWLRSQPKCRAPGCSNTLNVAD